MISIIITIFNRENTIEAAIESCLNQTFSDYEIILIDDGSTDNSARKVEKYLCENIKYFYQENQGAAAAKNRGVAEAQFDFVTFLDSDDLFSSPHTLQYIAEALHEDIDFISFKKVIFRKISGDVIRIDKLVSTDIDLEKHLLNSPLNYAGHHPYTFRRETFLQAGGFDINSKWGDALIFWRRFFRQRIKFKVIPEVGYIYNQLDSNSISRNRSSDYYLIALKVILRCYADNKDAINKQKSEKIWQLIIFSYALKSKKVDFIFNSLLSLVVGRIYYIPAAINYLLRTKVLK